MKHKIVAKYVYKKKINWNNSIRVTRIIKDKLDDATNNDDMI